MNELSKSHFKELIKLKQKKFRDSAGEVIVEGYRLIEQIFINGIELKEIFVTDPDKYDCRLFKNSKIYYIEPWQMEKLCSTKHPQDMAALVKTRTKPIKEKGFLLYLDSISEPGNLGTIVRTASAAGISGIILSTDCCEIFNPKVIRASMGSVFSIPIEIHNINWLKEQNSTIIVTTLYESQNLFELKKPEGNIILVLGSEAAGVRREIIELADYKVKIPISKEVESMNVAIAAGIAIYHLIKK